jgi:hypothetical protein
VRAEELADNVTGSKVPLAAALDGSRERRTVMNSNVTGRGVFREDIVLCEMD